MKIVLDFDLNYFKKLKVLFFLKILKDFKHEERNDQMYD